MTTEIDRRSQLTVVEPATGAKREQLIAECKSLIKQSKFDKLDVRPWNDFVGNMVDLIGGTTKNLFSNVETPYILDRENGRAIVLSISRPRIGGFSIVEIVPKWMSLPDKERREVELTITDPYVTERIEGGTWNALGAVNMIHKVNYPPKCRPKYESYLGIELTLVPDNSSPSPVPMNTKLSKEHQKMLAEKIFKAWQSSQPQTSPAPQA